jgi:hypothetical protein
MTITKLILLQAVPIMKQLVQMPLVRTTRGAGQGKRSKGGVTILSWKASQKKYRERDRKRVKKFLDDCCKAYLKDCCSLTPEQ